MKPSDFFQQKIIQEVWQYGQPSMTELEIGAEMEYECKKRGAERMVYPPVVGAGNRATILHYLVNSHIANDGDLVLMDAGCEYHGYASDITRTWPINGKFTEAQRQLYDVVHCVQSACIRLVRPGTTLNEIHEVTETLMTGELGKLTHSTGKLDWTPS
ncbi:xaa-Pro aminopeptidase 3-like isoform X1 [Corticium candelabrum]|uniref:xaa-Pro aminopeptidase 3-like isoform X1 n=1 Tax=Corticium candelabrum TaxID=121492 RepID=UPI002E269738|nr:xaa-Pro aminopeptidase 3-like isoform X1 [Corticium candelabrum]XP_062522748.1 xaa-Pro aminopeptidase 3-like isoform X1 [Corticium candelabrum]